MSHPIFISILALSIENFVVITANYLEVENGYLKKPMVERNNIVNKGVWVRSSRNKDNFDNGKIDDFIFRPNSLDVDNLIQSDTYGDFVSTFVERHRRHAKVTDGKRRKRSVNNCTGKNCNTNNIVNDDTKLSDQSIITKLKPASVFNDYPYEIAVLLDATRKELERAQNYSERTAEDKNRTKLIPLDEVKTNYSINIETIIKADKTFRDAYNTSDGKNDSSLLSNVENKTKLVKKNENIEDVKSSVSHKIDRDVFDKDHPAWQQNVPFPQTTSYKVRPKTDENLKKNRPITERGLIKVLSMLTKTFKKIMKQHDDIKEIHKKMHNMNKNFLLNIDTLTEKFKDFDNKYSNLLEVNDRLKDLEAKFNAKELYFKNKENELSKNLIEFESQQKKFLTQQRQFYNIQKLMLAQNEKISAKQNLITKTQCEISHRQNNFARILKKAKEIHMGRYNDNSKIASSYTKPNEPIKKIEVTEIVRSTTSAPYTTESIKINLFSIPSVTRLQNQDHLLLNERDEQPVDDLVYKYYFNNTFLDNLVRNKILSSLADETENSEIYNVKNKRNNDISHLHTTILLPVKKARGLFEQLIGNTLNRKRRWINHHSKHSRRKNRGKKNPPELNLVDDKFSKMTWKSATEGQDIISKSVTSAINTHPEEPKAEDPFTSMAKNFCNSIGQSGDKQRLEWCIEKALRRLQGIDTRLPTTPVKESDQKPLREREEFSDGIKAESSTAAVINSSPTSAQPMESTTSPAGTSTNFVQVSTTTPHVTSPRPVKTTAVSEVWPNPASSNLYSTNFFPDNDMLENNLKQYELKPDTEGTVYYDGSVHASEMLAEKSEGFSDLLLDQLESNSRIEVDPATFTLQAKRRAGVRKMNENIIKKMSRRPYGYKK